MSKRYIQDEIDCIKKHYGKIPTKEIAKRLERTVTGVQSKAWGLGLKMPQKEPELIEPKPCKYCNKPIPIKDKNKKYYDERTFCSDICSNRYYAEKRKQQMPIKYCLYCSKEINPKSWDYPKNFTKRKYCNYSCRTKHLWQNPDYRNQIVTNATKGVKKYARTPEARARQCKISKELWKQSEYREKVVSGLQQYYEDPEIRQEISERTTKQWEDPDHRNHVSKTNREISLVLWQNSEWAEKVLKGQNRHPNSPESQLIKLLNELDTNFEFTGGGGFTLARKIPDFVDIEAKQIIEMFGIYWHNVTEVEKRIELFRKYGYETLIIWDTELQNLDNVRDKIKTFITSS